MPLVRYYELASGLQNPAPAIPKKTFQVPNLTCGWYKKCQLDKSRESVLKTVIFVKQHVSIHIHIAEVLTQQESKTTLSLN